ncbi:MAG: GTPase ObgE [Planctomycetota bacterium]
MFVDTAVINCRAGNGGDGCVSLHRAKGVPKGGPDGGDGGDGGNVIFATDQGINTLYDFRGAHDWAARNGEPGRGKQQYGAKADDLIIRVPAGTLIYDDDTGELLADLGHDDRQLLLKGGKGGFGNEHYKSSTNQTPRTAQPGEAGEARVLRLELKLIADAGLIGKPNAGKSTLLSMITRADPKIGAYPFTTLSPQLGIAELDPARRLVLADIPGLIEGAADGAGLGHEFLRHVERTRLLVHVLDAVPPDDEPAADTYRAIRAELAAYSSALAEKPEVIALNKLDLVSGDQRDDVVRKLRSDLRIGSDTPVVGVSGATGFGLNELLETLWPLLEQKQMTKAKGWGR